VRFGEDVRFGGGVRFGGFGGHVGSVGVYARLGVRGWRCADDYAQMDA
jgi:hypothetical protein